MPWSIGAGALPERANTNLLPPANSSGSGARIALPK
eukprot:gene44549-48314_t